MFGPGEYVPDETLGVTNVEDLPKPKIRRRSRNFRNRPCPFCGRKAFRQRTYTRHLHDLGDPYTKRPVDIELTYSQHCCPTCGSHFNAKMDDLASPKSRYTRRVVDLALRLIHEDGLPYRAASWHLWRDHRVFVPWGTIQNWVEAAGKKSGKHNQKELFG